MRKLKRKLKKIKKDTTTFFQKKKKAVYNFLSAQMFYLKNMSKAALNFLKTLFSVVLLMITIVFTMLFADRSHKEYLEHVIGEEIVLIRSTPESPRKGSATGFHIKARSGNVVLVTNAHVCELADNNNIVLIEDKKYSGRLIPKRVLEIYKDNDLCVVEPLPGYKGLVRADGLSVGEPVWSIGYPLGESLNISSGRVKDFGLTSLVVNTPLDKCQGGSFTKKEVMMFFFITTVCVATYESIQTDVTTYGGNSGSPLLNIWGNVVGVVFAANVRTAWGRAVPLNHLNKLLEAY
jgi:S1-C subfamily serine protease